MFAHVSVGVSNIERSVALYDKLMDSLGYARLFGEIEEKFMAYGEQDSFFIINIPLNPERGASAGSNGAHICIKTKTKEQVDAFYAHALEEGCKDAGAPGVREHYAKDYYAAYIYDFDGNKIEVLARVS